MGRQPNGRPTIFQGADEKWHAYVTIGKKDNGQPLRKHIERGTATEVSTAIDDLQERISRGRGIAAKIETVEQWLTFWLENVVEPGKAYKTHTGYRSLITNHVIPNIGRWKLDGTRNRLEPEHVERMYSKLRRAGLASSHLLKIHSVLRKALKDATRRGRAARNVCDMIDRPRARRAKVDAHSLEEVQAIIGAAGEDPQAARWLVGLLLGLRQGEVLGQRWHRVHLDAASPHLEVAKQLQRRTWQHGCKDAAACVAEVNKCRTRCPVRYEHGCADPGACKGRPHYCPTRRKLAGCSRHTRPCPPPCRPGCAGHARWCPDRRGGGLVEVDVKSEKGVRTVPLPPILVELLRRVREEQIGRSSADWDPKGLVFVNQLGRPIDPRRDHAAWEELLERAGVEDSRLHAARHTAGTFLLSTGTDVRVVQEILGHSRITVTEGYVDVAADMKRQAVDRIAAALMDGQLTALLGAPAADRM